MMAVLEKEVFAGPYTTFFLSWGGGGGGGGELLGELENMASLQSFTLGGSAPPGNVGNFRCSEVHSGAF